MKETLRRRTHQQRDNRRRNAPGEARQHHRIASVPSPSAQRRRIQAGKMCGKQLDPRQKLAGHSAGAQAEEIFDLRGSNQNCDAVGKPDDDHPRNEANGRAQAGQPHRQQNESGHQRDHRQAAHAEARHNARDDHHKCSGRPADLGARSAQRRDQEPGDHRGIQAGLRRNSRSDAKGHGKRQRHQANSDARQKIMQKYLRSVRTERQNRFGKVRIEMDMYCDFTLLLSAKSRCDAEQLIHYRRARLQQNRQ